MTVEGMMEENPVVKTVLSGNEEEMSGFAVVVGVTFEDAGLKLNCWCLNEILYNDWVNQQDLEEALAGLEMGYSKERPISAACDKSGVSEVLLGNGRPQIQCCVFAATVGILVEVTSNLLPHYLLVNLYGDMISY